MKKILSILSSIGLSASMATTVIACTKHPGKIPPKVYVPQLLPENFEWNFNSNGAITNEIILEEMQKYLIFTNEDSNYQLTFGDNINNIIPRHSNDVLVLIELNNITNPFVINYSVTGYRTKDSGSFNIDNGNSYRDSFIKIKWAFNNQELDSIANFTLENNDFNNNKDYQEFIWDQLSSLLIKTFYKLDNISLNFDNFKDMYNILFVDDLNNLFYNNDFNNSIKYSEYGKTIEILFISSKNDEPSFEQYINISLKNELLMNYRFNVSNLQKDISFPDISVSNFEEVKNLGEGNLESQIEIYKQVSQKVGIDLVSNSFYKTVYFYDDSEHKELIDNLPKYWNNMQAGTKEELLMILDFDRSDRNYLFKGQLENKILISKI
ncbi:lipoprotein [Spiroplasma culicicola]|uniref:Lipoprotein n=1 Tax=Spiroplasma culicicola AES-1 TaxID=1276246 RepID=W6A878_9MOLU|nr:lipoprotein [Spiroplasma culicicola]AHI53095.1 hypothetical protein SCULI_v1c07540 [Spiroplasma culicicola AES-1]